MLPDDSKPFDVVCSANDIPNGCVLMPFDDDEHEHVIRYQSRQLMAAERNYPVHDKELLAMQYALIKFRVYLLGEQSFAVYTDHASLLAAPGKNNILADALSRRPDCDPCEALGHQVADVDNDENEFAICIASGINLTFTTPTLPLGDEIAAAYDEDPIYADILKHLCSPSDATLGDLPRPTRNQIDRYQFDGDSLTCSIDRFNDPRVVVPNDADLRACIIHAFHDASIKGHLGRKKTYAALSRDFYWLHMYKCVRKWPSVQPADRSAVSDVILQRQSISRFERDALQIPVNKHNENADKHGRKNVNAFKRVGRLKRYHPTEILNQAQSTKIDQPSRRRHTGQSGCEQYHRKGLAPIVDSEGDTRWIVDHIVAHEYPPEVSVWRNSAARAVPAARRYRVRWLEYNPEDDTWEPHVNLLHGVPDVILKYEFSVSSGNEAVGRPADTTNETVDASNDDATVCNDENTKHRTGDHYVVSSTHRSDFNYHGNTVKKGTYVWTATGSTDDSNTTFTCGAQVQTRVNKGDAHEMSNTPTTS
ncbi:hypothetical protein PC114_g14163 [Phytophthora cactorum]|nr:hypothetical protein PC114_g14163 [Phytophthora cactorum]